MEIRVYTLFFIALSIHSVLHSPFSIPQPMDHDHNSIGDPDASRIETFKNSAQSELIMQPPITKIIIIKKSYVYDRNGASITGA